MQQNVKVQLREHRVQLRQRLLGVAQQIVLQVLHRRLQLSRLRLLKLPIQDELSLTKSYLLLAKFKRLQLFDFHALKGVQRKGLRLPLIHIIRHLLRCRPHHLLFYAQKVPDASAAVAARKHLVYDLQVAPWRELNQREAFVARLVPRKKRHQDCHQPRRQLVLRADLHRVRREMRRLRFDLPAN